MMGKLVELPYTVVSRSKRTVQLSNPEVGILITEFDTSVVRLPGRGEVIQITDGSWLDSKNDVEKCDRYHVKAYKTTDDWGF